MVFLLDVCIPTFNRAGHLDSLLSQLSEAIAAGNHGEQVRVVVSDNASTDSTPMILEEWRRREPNWELSSRESNVGMMMNFQYLVSGSDGDYVWLLGDDDELISIGGIGELVEELRSVMPGLLILVGSEVGDLFPSGGSQFPNPGEFVSYFATRDPDFLRRQTWISANIFRREVFDIGISLNHIAGWYMHMYGIFGGLKNLPEVVRLMPGLIVQPAKIPGLREQNFPDTAEFWIEWKRYYLFLARKFREPKLRRYASRWSVGFGYRLRKWRDNLFRIWRWLKAFR